MKKEQEFIIFSMIEQSLSEYIESEEELWEKSHELYNKIADYLVKEDLI